MRALLTTRRVFVTVFALGLVAMGTRSVTDPDVWWHLRTGQQILQNHRVFHTDPYSFTRFGQPWVNHEWLSDVLLFVLYHLAGFGGLTLVFAAITAATLLLVFLRSPGRPYVAACVTLWGAFASAPTWGVRPQMLSLLLASVFLLLLESSYARPRILWWTPGLMLLWVNLHAGYALGLALIVLFLIGEALETALRSQPWHQTAPRLRRLGLALLLGLAVVPLNPNGIAMFSYPFETLLSPAMQGFINEWSSPNFHDPKYLPFLWMLLALVAGLGLLPRSVRARDLLLLLAAACAALRSVRHIPIFVLVAVPLLSALADTWLRERGAYRFLARERPTLPRTLVANALVLSACVVFVVVRLTYVVRGQGQAEAAHFPVGAAAFLSRQDLPGAMLNHYNWGGYFIWKLYPQYRVYIDGRADVYGDKLMDEFAAAYYLTDDWRKPLAMREIRTVILPPDAPLVTALRSKPEWKEIHADSQSVILTLSTHLPKSD